MHTDDQKPADEQHEADHEEAKTSDEQNLQAVSTDIDRQMKELAEMSTQVLIARDQLADFQEMIQEKIHAFQQKRAENQADDHSDIMQSIRDAKDEAAKFFRESEAINEAYDKLHKQFEKGREAALRESRKAEKVFKEKFHEVESKLAEKAKEIKQNIKNK